MRNISLKAACIPAIKTVSGASEPIIGHFVRTLHFVTNDGKKLNDFPCDVNVHVINSIKPSLILSRYFLGAHGGVIDLHRKCLTLQQSRLHASVSFTVPSRSESVTVARILSAVPDAIQCITEPNNVMSHSN